MLKGLCRKKPLVWPQYIRNTTFNADRLSRTVRYCEPYTSRGSGVSIHSSLRSLQTLANISKRDIAALEDRIWSKVGSNVKDPILQKDLSSLEWLDRRLSFSDDNETIRILLRVPTLLHPSLSDLQQKIKEVVEDEIQRWASEKEVHLDGKILVDVPVTTTKPLPMMARLAEDYKELTSRLGPGLCHTIHYLAVYSCKGGVGKSTVAVNLAYEMARMGGRVGLLDVDIYGPSLPIMVTPDDPAVRQSSLGKGMVHPIQHEGVKLLSLGYVSKKSGVPGSGPSSGAAVMRGPMAGSVVAQLLKGTDWGELDVLILDLPPGTGDVQLAVCQELQLSGAVAVTTPSKLATEDTRKGIEMFTSLGVPTLAVVENMSYFVCNNCNTVHFPFGEGLQRHNFNRQDGTSVIKDPSCIIKLPISTVTNDSNDIGSPICVTRPPDATDELAAFETLAKEVSRELLLLQHGEHNETSQMFVMFEKEAGSEKFDVENIHLTLESGSKPPTFKVRVYSDKGAIQIRFDALELRTRDPKTGIKLKDDDQDANEESSQRMLSTFIASKAEKRGHYGYSVEWEDGSTIIYSNLSIAMAAGGVVK